MPAPTPAGRFDFLLTTAPLALVALACAAYVPNWDAAGYLTCLVDALRSPRGLPALNCADHLLVGYFGALVVPFALASLHYGAIIATNVALAALGAHALGDLSALASPDPEGRAERALVMLGLTLSPLFVACAVQLTPDFGVAVYLLCVVRALARQRPGQAAVFGALLSSSKETGAVIYVLVVATYLLVYVAQGAGDARARLRALARHAVLASPPALVALWLAARLLSLGDRAVWRGGGMTMPMWRQVLTVSWLDNVFPSQLAEVFVLNFAWVLSVFIAAHAAGALWRRVTAAPAPDLDRPGAREARFVTLAFLATLFAVTRIRTFVIPRYVLPAVVMLPLMGQLSLRALGVEARARRLVLGLFAALSAVACVRSQDGVSLRLLGSFPFGAHPVVDVTGWTHEVPSRRDHLVYNLEFTRVAALLDDALPFALADGRHALAINRHAAWYLINCVDRATHRRVVCTPGALRPKVWTLELVRHEDAPPPLLYYLEQPGMDDDDELINWRQRYRVGEARRFDRGGYSIGVRELRLRDPRPSPGP